jgi:hypothetical protein
VIHLYALVRGAPPVGAPLRIVSFGRVGAVVGPACDALRHGLAVEDLAERCDSVLPVRFGERFESEAALRTSVAPRLDVLARRLEELSGLVEIGVRVAAPEQGRPPIDTGTDYMHAAAARDAALRMLDHRLRPRARDGSDGRYLVARDDVEGFAAEVERYAAEHPELAVVCTGPWAPYSFAA